MANTEERIVKIVDESVHTRGVSVEQVDSYGALMIKDAAPPDYSNFAQESSLGNVDNNVSNIKENVQVLVDSIDRLPTEEQNPVISLTYDVAENLSTITKTINGTSYTKTLTYTDNLVTNISEWS